MCACVYPCACVPLFPFAVPPRQIMRITYSTNERFKEPPPPYIINLMDYCAMKLGYTIAVMAMPALISHT